MTRDGGAHRTRFPADRPLRVPKSSSVLVAATSSADGISARPTCQGASDRLRSLGEDPVVLLRLAYQRLGDASAATDDRPRQGRGDSGVTPSAHGPPAAVARSRARVAGAGSGGAGAADRGGAELPDRTFTCRSVGVCSPTISRSQRPARRDSAALRGGTCEGPRQVPGLDGSSPPQPTPHRTPAMIPNGHCGGPCPADEGPTRERGTRPARRRLPRRRGPAAPPSTGHPPRPRSRPTRRRGGR